MVREFHIKGSGKILATIKNFRATEKVIFSVFAVLAICSSLYMAVTVNSAFLVPIPAHGGTLKEGVVGLPRSINPILAITDVDRDLSSLLYSGLTKYENGKIVPDIVQKYEISPDGLTYTFTLKTDIYFHDGALLTTEDVEFTIKKIQDNVIKSPRSTDWANVTVEKISPSVIKFILKQAYTPFLSNTTIGILPKHIWTRVESDQFIYSQYNVEPIGSGPFKLEKIQHDSGGIPEYYILSPHKKYYGKRAFIENLTFYFFPNEKSAIEAYHEGIVESLAGISSNEASRIATSSDAIEVLHTPLPRIFGVFFNQNQASVLAHKEVRQALNIATPKDDIVKEVLLGYGIRIDSPLPFGLKVPSTTSTTSGPLVPTNDIEAARALLIKEGWTVGTDGVLEKRDKKGVERLEFSISTADASDLKQVAEVIKEKWEKMGAKVTIKIFEYGDLYQNIIATRKYDALLFGEFIGKDLDLYAFWHSSQRNSPGLNVSMYVNSKVDKLLEEARSISNPEEKAKKYEQFEQNIIEDIPAIFLYSPEYIYIVPKKVKGLKLDHITVPSERFSNVNSWYISEDLVWKIFVNN